MKTFFKYLKLLFCGRNKFSTIGIWLGSLCFVPTFIVTLILLGLHHAILSIIYLIITQTIWLTSITLCLWGVDKENRQLKEELRLRKGDN